MTVAHPPVLAVADVERAIGWWRDRMGFEVTFRNRHPTPDDEPNYGVVERDDVEVHLARRTDITDARRAEITILVADLPAMSTELDGRGVPSTRLPTQDVAVRDLDGNRIVFRQAVDDGITRSA